MPLPPTFPDLAALDLFASVVTLGSMSQAAISHGISQPSASARMRTLETKLGLTLLERGPTGSVPTPAGHLVAGWVEGMLRAADELATGVEALKARHGGRLRVAASFTVAEYLLPAWLGRFHREHPDNPVELDVANSTEVLDRVRRSRTDLGFIESPAPATGLSTVPVGTDELVVVVAPTHPWARLGRISARRLSGAALVLREPGSGTREFFDHALAVSGHGPAIAALELGSTAAIKNAVAGGELPSVLSRLAVSGDEAAGRLVVLDVDDLDLARVLRAVWRSDRPLPDAAEALLAQVRAATTPGTPSS